MKMKRLQNVLLLSGSLFLATTAHAQLYVKNNGYTGFGTNNPVEKVHVLGTARFQVGGNVIGIHPKLSGTSIGSTADVIKLWWGAWGYNKIWAEKFVKVSDSTKKENINPLTDGLSVVLQMAPKSYNLKVTEDSNGRKEYGFLAQDIEILLPDLVTHDSNVLLLDYDQIIPFLVRAVQEQQEHILDQDTLIDSLITEISSGNKTESFGNPFHESGSASSLEQNAPNPYRENTRVRFYVAEGSTSASLLIFNLNGGLLRSYPIEGSGQGEVLIERRDLKPGMYLYSLVVDGLEVETLKMIISEK